MIAMFTKRRPCLIFATGQFLQERTFRGLEQKLGEHSPSILEQGRSGVAKGYGELDEDQAPMNPTFE